ncbi:hypothetical protein CKO31_08835 [Thiohalocapsa halophila]|uniref:CPXCG motif-containing cysteine-rich protein n=1 Tax=Thiohalocapsa halophila TaxID=69359 RepID=A0ABS1CG02_9GAMM|nr:CPXCG motif-containing cysteine-rich protein [Thiohalocapsa halophila]MBK1630846.1 hypothetical protein [Thiohalocapsa halophila]
MELLQIHEQQCPWCGELIELAVDCSYGDHVFVEDCAVCCAPIQVAVSFAPGPQVSPSVEVRREND